MEQKQLQTVLVTGGAGYIGAHVVRQLSQAGHKVVVIDDLSVGNKDNLASGTATDLSFVQGDFSDPKLLEEIFTNHKVKTVMHLAAKIEVGESVEKPLEYLENNTLKTARLIEGMLAHNVTQLVFSSTAAVYGLQEKVPIPETAKVGPLDPYGTSKLLCEQLIDYFSRFSGLNAIIFRYFNACGSDFDKTIQDSHKSHLIPFVIEVVNGSQQKIVINGNDYNTPDGTAVRDYVHVLDIAKAHLVGLERLKQLTGVELYNIGTGTGQSVKEVIAMVEQVTGKPVSQELGARRPGDSPITVADNAKITKTLGFALEHSDLETIIKTSWH